MELEPSVFRGTLRSVEKMEASVVPRTVGKGKRGEPELQKCAPIEEMSGVAETCNDTSFPAAYLQQSPEIGGGDGDQYSATHCWEGEE